MVTELLTEPLLSREDYFREMQKRGRVAYSYIVKSIEEEYPDKGAKKAVMYFVSRRGKEGKLLKPFIVSLSYEASGGEDWKSIVPIAAACELINISSYQSNAAFDNKYGVLEKLEKDNQIIASFLTRELAQKLVSSFEVDCQKQLLDLMSEVNECIYIGQFKELNSLHFKNLNSSLSLNAYLEIYLNKCYTISGIFTRNCAAIGYSLAEEPNLDILQALKTFGVAYGIALNIVNDMSDYIPPDEGLTPVYKNLSDQFSDVRNGRIFLPVFYALAHGNQKQHDFIMGLLDKPKQADMDTMRELLDILIRTGAMGFSYSVAKSFMKIAHYNLKKLPDSYARNLLSIMASSIRTNKFLFALRKHGLRAMSLDADTTHFLERYSRRIF